jgi:sec-independent protein translocase protein TatA
MSPIVLAIFGLGPQEIILIAIVGLLIFGRRLPDLARSLGKSVVEFKKGVKGLEDDTNDATAATRSEPAAELPRPPQRITPAAPRFEETPADKPNTPS